MTNNVHFNLTIFIRLINKCNKYFLDLTDCIEKMNLCVSSYEKEANDLFNSKAHVMLSRRTKLSVRAESSARAASICSNKFCDCVASKSLDMKIANSTECGSNIELMCYKLQNGNIAQFNDLINKECKNFFYNLYF